MTFFNIDSSKITALIDAFKINWIMLTIVGFYFGGGAFEGLINAKKNGSVK